MCVNIGGGEGDCASRQWKGDIWVDAAELQPVRIQTDLNFKISLAVRFFLGTNIRRLGFSVSYIRVAEGVWFPASYGTGVLPRGPEVELELLGQVEGLRPDMARVVDAGRANRANAGCEIAS